MRLDQRRRRGPSFIVFLSFAALCLPIAAQAGPDRQITRGRMITRQNCSGCHAIGRVGTSPNRRAPPFRTLGARYPLADLTEALTEGIISGHNEMPQFQFSGPQAQAIVAYLQSIQSR